MNDTQKLGNATEARLRDFLDELDNEISYKVEHAVREYIKVYPAWRRPGYIREHYDLKPTKMNAFLKEHPEIETLGEGWARRINIDDFDRVFREAFGKNGQAFD